MTKVTGEMLDALEADVQFANTTKSAFNYETATRKVLNNLPALLSLSRRVIEPGEEEIERCARALCAAQGWTWLDEDQAERDGNFSGADYCEHARAVLAAIAEG